MTRKIAISLPDDTLERAQAAVTHGKARTVSNYIALLIDQQSASESFEAMVEDWLRQSKATKGEVRRAERQAQADFERAGLSKREKPVRRTRSRDETRRKAG